MKVVVRDTPGQLLRKIQLGEDSLLECKQVIFSEKKVKGPSRDHLAEELVAFANSREGGVMILGVDDRTREIIGIPLGRLDLTEQFIQQILNDSIEPPLDVIVERLELSDTLGRPQPVLRIDIPPSLFVHRGPSGYFCRRGSAKREMRSDELARLMQHRQQTGLLRFDEQTVSRTSSADFTPDLISRFRTPQTLDSDDIYARKLGMASPDKNGELHPTVAGVLLGTDQPQQWLPGAWIQAVAYRGADIGESGNLTNYQLDAKDIFGPLDLQVVDACKFVAKNQKIRASKSMGREDHPQYDMTVIFEAIVNAVAHRDYSVHGSKVRLRMFSNRIEMYSPGELPNTLELDSLAYRQVTRNETITSLLAKIPIPDDIPLLGTSRHTFMDRRGEGVGQILMRSKALSGKEPVYDMPGGDELRLTIFAAGAD